MCRKSQNCYYLQIPGATPNIHNAAAAAQLSADLAAVCAWGRCGVASPGLLPKSRKAPLHDVRGGDGGASLWRTLHCGANSVPPVSEGSKSGSPSDARLRSPCIGVRRDTFTPCFALAGRSLGSRRARRCAASARTSRKIPSLGNPLP